MSDKKVQIKHIKKIPHNISKSLPYVTDPESETNLDLDLELDLSNFWKRYHLVISKMHFKPDSHMTPKLKLNQHKDFNPYCNDLVRHPQTQFSQEIKSQRYFKNAYQA